MTSVCCFLILIHLVLSLAVIFMLPYLSFSIMSSIICCLQRPLPLFPSILPSIIWVTGRFAHCTFRPMDDSPHGRFRPIDDSPLRRFAPWSIGPMDDSPHNVLLRTIICYLCTESAARQAKIKNWPLIGLREAEVLCSNVRRRKLRSDVSMRNILDISFSLSFMRE